MMDEFLKYKIKDDSEGGFPNSPPLIKLNKKRLLKFVLVFFGIMILVGGGYLTWNNYLSPSAQYARQANANYQKYLDQQSRYEAAMTADTYGGKTPEETITMFKDALIKKDVELASDYFLLDEDGEKNPLIKQNLQKLFDDNQIQKVLDLINNLKPSAFDTGDSGLKEFVVLTQQGFVNYSVTLKLNKYSNVWKIESL